MSEILHVHTSSNTMHKHSQPSPQTLSSRSLSRVQSSQPSSLRQSGISDTVSTKRGRGPAKGPMEWGTGVKLKVEFDSKFQPIGKNEKWLKSALENIVRNEHRVPFTYIDWASIPVDILDTIWKEVEAEFDVQLSQYDESDRTPPLRDQIFHKLLGADRHGYCKTYSTEPQIKAEFDKIHARICLLESQADSVGGSRVNANQALDTSSAHQLLRESDEEIPPRSIEKSSIPSPSPLPFDE
ncbi:unnamed protein product, partial [Ilex paraguariensis]